MNMSVILTFTECATLSQLQAVLEDEPLYMELLQDDAGPGCSPVVLATFETSGLEFIFPHPQIKHSAPAGVDVDLLMEPSSNFPGIISPKVCFFSVTA